MKNIFWQLFSFFSLLRYKNIEIGKNVKFASWRVKGHCKSEMKVGNDSIVHGRFYFEKEGAKALIGQRTFIGNALLSIADQVEIGNDVMISWGVTITDHNSHSVIFSERSEDIINWHNGLKEWNNVAVARVTIHDKAWIGFNVTILKGVSIGEGAVVGAGSVVTKDVPSWTVVAGNPAKIIRELEPNER